MSMLFNSLVEQVTQEAKQKGLLIHCNYRIKYSVIFGNIEINSPYLWDKEHRRGISPVKEKLGIKSGERSPYVKSPKLALGQKSLLGKPVNVLKNIMVGK